MRFLLRSILTGAGHLTLEAEHGQAALEQLAAHPDVALLVTDLAMPVMDGLELLQTLRPRTTLPKLIVSGCSVDPLLTELGVSAFFGKPLELTRFKRTVLSLLTAPATPV